MSAFSEVAAAAILRTALAEERAGELMDCLFDGGSATVDAVTGELVLVGPEQLAAMAPADVDEMSNNVLAAGAVFMVFHKAGIQAVPVFDGELVTNVVEVKFDFLKSPYRLTVKRVDSDQEPF